VPGLEQLGLALGAVRRLMPCSISAMMNRPASVIVLTE
jgi:hypothetical protein